MTQQEFTKVIIEGKVYIKVKAYRTKGSTPKTRLYRIKGKEFWIATSVIIEDTANDLILVEEWYYFKCIHNK